MARLPGRSRLRLLKGWKATSNSTGFDDDEEEEVAAPALAPAVAWPPPVPPLPLLVAAAPVVVPCVCGVSKKGVRQQSKVCTLSRSWVRFWPGIAGTACHA